MGFKAFCKKTGAVIYKHRADIGFGVGLGLVAVGTTLLINDSEKISTAFDECKYRSSLIKDNDAAEAEEAGAGWRDEQERKEFLRDHLKETVKDMTKTVGKDVAFVIAGEGLQFISHKSLKSQLANMTLLAGNLSVAYGNLKKKIVEDQGQEKLDEYLYGPQIKKVVVDEEGNVTETTELLKDTNKDVGLPPHCFFFDELSTKFNKSAAINKDTIENLYFWLNQKLHVEGFLFENDIRREFGLPLVKCGWTSGIFAEDPKTGEKNTLSFGFEHPDAATQRFLDGYENTVIIKLNVEDDILSQLHLFSH